MDGSIVALVSAFGIFACVQLLRGKSAKTLMLALTLGVVVNLIGMVAYPVFKTFLDDPSSHRPDPPSRNER